ncbi:substrate-binding protein [Halomicrobium salinisoli]|uniref:substrate-binding protein n=1 Tax=Halomicrobium salinisoli TaxID=2878391 RepID=UPI001CF019E4|nr:substrate-binding protein [Halomicrobium salinisoli]
MTDDSQPAGESRRQYLKGLAAGGLAAGLAGCQGDGGDGGGNGSDGNGGGQQYQPIGNFPLEGDTVAIGFNGPLSGALGPDGQDQEKGFDLAVQHLNNGGGLVDSWDALSGDGILGNEVEPTKADTAGDPDTANQNINGMIQQDNIQFWTGGMSSTVTMAMQDVAQREKVPFMGGNSTSAGISGENCSRYYFHPTFHAEIIGMAAGQALPQVLGEDRQLFHIYMDYSYGQSNRDAMRKHLAEDGPWEDVGGAAIAEGESDHQTQIQELQDSGADVVHFASFGEFAASGLSQMVDAGVTEDVEVFIPHVSAFTLDPMGSDAEGVYGMEPWNPNYDNEASQTFVQAYQDEYGEVPNQSSMHTYESMMVYAAAVEQAGTFHPPTVVRTLEEFSWEQAWGPSQFRTCDHQVERPWHLVQGVDDSTAEELGIRTDIVQTTDPLVYECGAYPANECNMDDNEYGDE